MSPLPNVITNSATESVEEIVLPFAKDIPFWKKFESMEAFTRTPQRPHFGPLVETHDEVLREGAAYGLMWSFSRLTEKVENMEKDFPISQLDLYKQSFATLEEHGFHVRDSLSRINELSSAKDGQANMSEEQKGFDESGKEPKLNKV